MYELGQVWWRKRTDGAGVLSILLYSGRSFGVMTLQEGRVYSEMRAIKRGISPLSLWLFKTYRFSSAVRTSSLPVVDSLPSAVLSGAKSATPTHQAILLASVK